MSGESAPKPPTCAREECVPDPTADFQSFASMLSGLFAQVQVVEAAAFSIAQSIDDPAIARGIPTFLADVKETLGPNGRFPRPAILRAVELYEQRALMFLPSEPSRN
jgi:hypothetical protein